MRRFTASADVGRRLDLYLSSRLPEVSRTRIQELIDEGRVRFGGRLVRRAQRVMSGDVIDIEVLPLASAASRSGRDRAGRAV